MNTNHDKTEMNFVNEIKVLIFHYHHLIHLLHLSFGHPGIIIIHA